MRCTLCRDAVAPMYCNVHDCHTHLCKDCVVQHLSDEVDMMSVKQSISTPGCSNHQANQCELHCEQCNIPVCTLCVSSKEHRHHDFVDFVKNYETKQEDIRRDLLELENSIYPRYQNVASSIPIQRVDVRENSKKLAAALKKQGEALHKEVDFLIQSMQFELDERNAQYLAAIDIEEDKNSNQIKEICRVIQNLKNLLETSDVSLVSKYKSRNEELRKMSPKVRISFPSFQPQTIKIEALLEQLRSLFLVPTETEKKSTCNCLHSPGNELSPEEKSLLDVPQLITDIDTDFKYLYNVSCLSDEEIWTRGNANIMKLYNLHGELVQLIRTKSGNWPEDIAVTLGGDLVYTDSYDRSINIVKESQVQPLIILQGWKPDRVCCTSSGDLLVILCSDNDKQTKIVRYSGSTEKQCVQWDDEGQPLFKSGNYIKDLTENRNLDICVADNRAGAVVVVSAAGKLRFRYTGPINSSFYPRGITTDSQGRILTSDYHNRRLHILDQDGNFLRYIDNCGFNYTRGLCVDSRDNLFVADVDTGTLMKIKYCQ